MDAPCFDSVIGVPLDTMHSIDLGLCKTIFYLLLNESEVRPDSDEAKEYANSLSKEALTAWQASNKGKTTVKLPSLLNEKHDLSRLQDFMDSCSVPRDVGRIPQRIKQKMANMKAAEWNSWISIFAVPHLMELMREKHAAKEKEPFRFASRHLQLFVDMRTVAEMMRGYSFTPQLVLDMERLMMKVVTQVETLFGANAVTPNMHYCLHLGEMIMRFGPPAGFSCNAFERWNLLMGNIPMNRAHPEKCMIRRGKHISSISQWIIRMAAQHRPDQLVAPLDAPYGRGKSRPNSVYDFIESLLSGSDVEMISESADPTGPDVSLRRNQWGTLQQTYRWKSDSSFLRFRRHLDVVGSEPFPGGFRGCAVLGNLHDASAVQEQHWRKYIDEDHLLNCLITHYENAYKDLLPRLLREQDTERHSKINASIAELTRQSELLDVHAEHRAQTLAGINRQIKSLNTSKKELLKPKNLIKSIGVHSVLDLGGQVFHSCRGGSPHSLVWIWWYDKRKWTPSYARVNFYFTHDFMTPTQQTDGTWRNVLTTHYFAALQYFQDHVELNGSIGKKLWGDVVCPMQYADELAFTNPYLSGKPDPGKQIHNIACVQSLAGRWIAARRLLKRSSHGQRSSAAVSHESDRYVLQAMAIPFDSKLHGI